MIARAAACRSPAGDAKPLPCALRQLKVSCFRNLAEQTLLLPEGPIVLFGDNGAGKTNLLEAVSMLAPGRGLRRARPVDQACVGGSGGWSLHAQLEGPHGRHDLATGLEKGQERRRFRLDGSEPVPRDALAALIEVIWLTPAEDRLFVEAPVERRRFLDRLIAADDPAYAGMVARYERRMRERTVLLRGGPGDDVWLATLEASLAAEAVAITAVRHDRVQSLDEVVARTGGSFPAVRLSLAGDLEKLLEDRPALDVEEEVAARLRQSREVDREAGGASIGPHRAVI